MGKPKQEATIEESLIVLKKRSAERELSVRMIFDQLAGRGRTLLLIFLSLPFCQIPGLSTLFGLLIAFFGLRLAFGHQAWLPKSLLDKTIPSAKLHKFIEKALWLLKKTRKWVKPRLSWVCRYPVIHMIHGVVICCLGLFIAVPLPIPLSNWVASAIILLICLGILEDDGVFVCAGYVLFILSIVAFTLLYHHFRTVS